MAESRRQPSFETVSGRRHGADVRIRRDAPAKLNLYLHVVGRRSDGYHLLDSLVAFAEVGDTVTVEPAAALSLRLEGPFAAAVPVGADNLVLRAARALAAEAAATEGAAVTLTKRLPPASSVGGGSADAAATLLALRDLWRLPLDDAALARIGLSLGADVPACLFGRPAFMAGIGEDLTPAPALPGCHVVLANPGIALPTPPVFQARRGPYSPPARFDEPAADAAALAALLAARHNDLTEAAISLAPVVAEALAALSGFPGCVLARMSGSGATCFGLFADAGASTAAAGALAAGRPGWWVAAAALRA